MVVEAIRDEPVRVPIVAQAGSRIHRRGAARQRHKHLGDGLAGHQGQFSAIGSVQDLGVGAGFELLDAALQGVIGFVVAIE